MEPNKFRETLLSYGTRRLFSAFALSSILQKHMRKVNWYMPPFNAVW